MSKPRAPTQGALPDPEAWATANVKRLRYFGCHICDLGPDVVAALNLLWEKGFRRSSMEKYLSEAGIKLPPMNDNSLRKHFIDGNPRDHGRA